MTTNEGKGRAQPIGRGIPTNEKINPINLIPRGRGGLGNPSIQPDLIRPPNLPNIPMMGSIPRMVPPNLNNNVHQGNN